MRNNILWYQSLKLDNADIVTLNGRVLPEGAESSRSFRQLKEVSDMAISHKSPWCGIVNGVYFVKGWLDAFDEKGRIIPFMFISEEKDGRSALKRELASVGYTMESSTKECVNKQSSKLSYSKIAIMAAIIIIIILIIVSYGK